MHRPNLPVIAAMALTAFLTLAARPAAAAGPEPFELKDGDRVLLVGGTFVEREGQVGYIEAALTARFAAHHVTFRNLGQSGDTVAADARNLNAGWVTFGPPDQGFNRLKALVAEIKPTVVIANYGMTESFAGPGKVGEFVSGYGRLLDMIVAAAGTKPRLVLLSPNYHENLGPPQIDPASHNDSLKAYGAATKELAEKRGARFVDLFALTEKLGKPAGKPLTDNGVHLTDDGYRRLAGPLLEAMGVPAASPGESALTADRVEPVRKLVVAKNADYFNYWRPQNDTYILGYRKKEQGRSAVDFPQFLPLVEAKEKEIAAATKIGSSR